MAKTFQVGWVGDLPGTPARAWDAITRRCAGWLWPIEYEPRVGGAERGLTGGGGEVTGWQPDRHFATRAEDADGVNELVYRLEPRGARTHLDFTHRGALPADDDYANQLDQCVQHTRFYYHSLVTYLRHFAGRDAAYASVDAPEASTRGGFAAVCRALGPDGGAVGAAIRLAPAGVKGTVDYRTPHFLGVRTDTALYRIFGRDAWGYPVGVTLHLFDEGADADKQAQAWSAWLAELFKGGE